MDSGHNHSASFVEKHNHRIKKQLEKLADLPKHYECQEVDHLHSKTFQVTISLETLTNLQIESLNRSQPINFEIVLADQYPFVTPQICCVTDIPLMVKINDRRNLIHDILGCAWSPAVILRDAIEKIPKFLKEVHENRNSKKYLHSLGQFVEHGVYLKEDLLKSALTCFECSEILRSVVIVITTERKSLIALSNTFLIVFEVDVVKSHYVFNRAYRLNEDISAMYVGERLELFFPQYDQKRTFEFTPAGKYKQFLLLFTHMREPALAKDESIGNVTGLFKSQLESRIDVLEKEIESEEKGKECGEKFQELKKCLSDIIEIESVEAEEKVDGYKTKLMQLFKNEGYLAKDGEGQNKG